MKLLKETALSVTRMAQVGARNNSIKGRPQAIKLRAVTPTERQHLRISSYQYLLP